MRKTVMNVLVTMICGVLFVGSMFGQTTAFTYQGSLSEGADPANGNYDLEFALFDAVSGGVQQGSTITVNAVAVTNGIFSVALDFGSQFPGTGRFLEIRVKATGGGAFTTLSPRQPVNSSPYSIKSLTSESATTATNATQLGGISPMGFIQNTTTQQPSSDFNVSGTGTANILSATSQFNIGANRILGVIGALSVGINSGLSSTGGENSFFGMQTGRETTTGSANSMFGSAAGISNTTGSGNSYFGVGAGRDNIFGSNNSLFGLSAGQFTTAGSNNTLVGANSNYGAGISFGTAIGAGAVVGTSDTVVLGRAVDTVQIPGNFFIAGMATGNGGGLTNLNAANIATGVIAPARLGTAAILNQTTQQASSDFNISGTGTANTFNAGTGFSIGGFPILSSEGANNLFVGQFGGSGAGNSNTFVGWGVGLSNSSGSSNSFFGRSTGSTNSSGASNSFFGAVAGGVNSTGDFNSFFGAGAGAANASGISNSFFGRSAGNSSTANDNSFFGANSGFSTSTGGGNTFLGYSAGNFNATGSGNTVIGDNADVSASNLNNATAIGSRAVVAADNSLVLGSISGQNSATADTNVGIGTTAPQSRLHVNGAIFVTGPRTATPVGNAMTLSSDAVADSIQTFNNRPLAINPSGNSVGIGTNAPLDKLHVNGIIRVSTLGSAGGSTLCRNTDSQIANCSSSLRYKTNIDRFGFGLGIINQLKPITFDWKDGGMHDFGLGAEDVAAIEPLLVTYNDRGEVEGVKYDRIGVVLVNAVKEQQAQIEAHTQNLGRQRAELAEQKVTIQDLRSQIAQLKAVVCAANHEIKLCQE